MKNYIKLMRVKHYIKNLLILFPIFFAGRFTETDLLLKNVIGMIAFCLVSSCVYIMNDLQDVEKDRLHPTKKNRPIASGAISVNKARVTLVILALIAVVAMFAIGADLLSWICLAVFFAINVWYSFGGKNIVVLDVVLLASGYPLRVIFGGFITNIEVSSWLFLTIVCMALFLGLGKRQGELAKGTNTREVLKYYNDSYLRMHMMLCLGLGLVFYSLWALEKSQTMIYTVPLVLIICMRYNLSLDENEGDPISTFFADKMLMGLTLVYAVAMVAIMYLG